MLASCKAADSDVLLLSRELWLEAAKKVFADLDSDSQGKVSSAALLNLVREKVPSSEVDYAVEDALVEAGYAGTSLLSSKDGVIGHVCAHTCKVAC